MVTEIAVLNGSAAKQDLTLIRTAHAEDHADGAAFARAVGSDKAENIALVDGEVEVGDRPDFAFEEAGVVGFGDFIEGDLGHNLSFKESLLSATA
jgi:hypothetical protein